MLRGERMIDRCLSDDACLMYPTRLCLQEYCGFAGSTGYNCWVIAGAHCPRCHKSWDQHTLEQCREAK